MAEINEAAFKFEKYRIPEFSYHNSNKSKTILNISIDPKGYYNKGTFDIELNVRAFDKDDANSTILTLKCIATFKFNSPISLNAIPSFFYKNSIAIVFPYLRAFISTLTLQANSGLIVLGLLNLSSLEQELIENTIETV